MQRNAIAITVVLAYSLLAIASAANGYGTSSIVLSNSTLGMIAGGSAAVGYSVNLASGNTWGTTLSVVNAGQLASDGISATLSNPSGDPPYSGTLHINASATAPPGTYTLVLAATGDDPSASNATLSIKLAPAPSVTTSVAPGPSANSTLRPSTTASSTTAYTTTVSSQPSNSTLRPSTTAYTTTVSSQPSNGAAWNNPPIKTQPAYGIGNAGILALYALIVLALSAFAITRMRYMATKLIIVGVALILLGIGVWLYGDYSGGLMGYIWSGVALLLIGTAVWLYGDYSGGAFRKR